MKPKIKAQSKILSREKYRERLNKTKWKVWILLFFWWILEFWVIPGQFTWEAKKKPSVDRRPKIHKKKKFKVRLNFLKASNTRFFLPDTLNSSLVYPKKIFKQTNLEIIPVDTPKVTWLEKKTSVYRVGWLEKTCCNGIWRHTRRYFNFWSSRIQINEKKSNMEFSHNFIRSQWYFKLGRQSLIIHFFATTYPKKYDQYVIQ